MKGLELAVEVTPDVPQKLFGDRNRLSQVLLNLLGNAVKFTEKGQVVVRIGPSVDCPGQWVFEVVDTGIGIPPALLPIIFTPFTQADGSFARRYGGSGLGLSISLKLTTLMDGLLETIHRPEGGSLFRLTLPLEPREEPPVAVSMPGRRALLLGTLPATLRVLEGQLRSMGIHVQMHPDPQGAGSALSGVSSLSYDLVVVVLDPDQMAGVPFFAPPDHGDAPDSNPLKVLCLPSHSTVPGGTLPGIHFDAVLSVPLRRAAFRRAIQNLFSPAAQRSPELDPRAESLNGLDLRPNTQSLRILVVDDNDMNREVFSQILVNMGHRVDTASDGLQALGIHQRDPFDLVLMDCQMPNMDGFESTRRIRSLEGPGAMIPIVALTGNAHPEDLERCLDSGMNDVLTKPVRATDLGAMIEKWSPSGPHIYG